MDIEKLENRELITCNIPLSLNDVRANCFCASLLCTYFTCHVMHRARALSSKVNNNKGKWPLLWLCVDLTILDVRWPLFFFSIDHFLCRFSTFCETRKKIYRVEVLIVWKTFYRSPFIWPLGLAVRQFKMPLKGLRLWKWWQCLKLLTQQIHLYKILLG